LSSSEKLRANAAISTDKKLAAARKQELADVRNLKNEMVALQAAEKNRFTVDV